MNETPAQPNIGRSVLCIVAGFIAVIVLSFGTDYLLHLIAGFPKLGEVYTDKQFLGAAIYRTLYGVVGSYVTAAVAPRYPMKHALIGGAIFNAFGQPGAYALNLYSILVAFVGAVVFLLILRAVRGRRTVV